MPEGDGMHGGKPPRHGLGKPLALQGVGIEIIERTGIAERKCRAQVAGECARVHVGTSVHLLQEIVAKVKVTYVITDIPKRTGTICNSK